MQTEWPRALAEGWHPIAYSNELKNKPLAVTLMDKLLVLFRSSTGVTLLEDRCPHRNVPLSVGKVIEGTIECPYHGWRFNGLGQCTKVPGSHECVKANAKSFAVREEGELIWACLADKPGEIPTLPPEISDSSYDSFWWQIPASESSVADVIENVLDPIHPYFMHPGLVRPRRDPQNVEIDLVINAEGITARYTEPYEGLTLLQRLIDGNRKASFGRYRAPTLVQVGFEDQNGAHALISVFFTPISRQIARPYPCFSTRKGRIPPWLKRLFIIAFHKPVVSQDRAMLKLQIENTTRFGGPKYHNGPVDLFGPAIWASLNGLPTEPMHLKLRFPSQDRNE